MSGALERGFLDDIVANIDDDTPRLVYADWLDENGQPERAEFIRVQCELARAEPWTPRHSELSARAKALLSPANIEAWTVPLGFNPYPNNFLRGRFYPRIRVPARVGHHQIHLP